MVEEPGEATLKAIGETLGRHMANAILESNATERAGLGLEETPRILDLGEIDEKKLVAAVESKLSASHINRNQREAVQHAHALQFIVEEMVRRDKLLSEELILQAHRILTANIDAPGGISRTEYAGRYRHIHVAVGNTNFVSPKLVPIKMKQLIN
ncbi:hypothetical protein FGG08_001295 [Glutinoglossum americanum]|uniref:Uncharacterized protein n=1 Tax=Glutinoglossum americanum TaxID=1670608 RepID=A0A9P8IGZ7_9PEZI|nr:hypothetical protein FGG08_001295 [Glutinoglossum americanum]